MVGVLRSLCIASCFLSAVTLAQEPSRHDLAVGLDLIGSSTIARFAEETAEFSAAGLIAVAAADISRSSPLPLANDLLASGERSR